MSFILIVFVCNHCYKFCRTISEAEQRLVEVSALKIFMRVVCTEHPCDIVIECFGVNSSLFIRKI